MNSINISPTLLFNIAFIIWLFFRYKDVFNNSKTLRAVLYKLKDLNIIREITIIAFTVYILKVISLVFFPIVIQFGSNIYRIQPTIWLNPLTSIINIFRDNSLHDIIYNILGNFILLMPLPLFLIYFWKDRFHSVLKIFLVCLCLSTSIELIQYFESIIFAGVGRFIETNDIILNTSGGVVGYIIYNKYIRKYKNILSKYF